MKISNFLEEVDYQPSVVPAACWELVREFMQGFLGDMVLHTPPPSFIPKGVPLGVVDSRFAIKVLFLFFFFCSCSSADDKHCDRKDGCSLYWRFSGHYDQNGPFSLITTLVLLLGILLTGGWMHCNSWPSNSAHWTCQVKSIDHITRFRWNEFQLRRGARFYWKLFWGNSVISTTRNRQSRATFDSPRFLRVGKVETCEDPLTGVCSSRGHLDNKLAST